MERFAGKTESSHLPPLEVAPILESYNPKLARVSDDALIEPIYDDNGVVDIESTVELALKHVDPNYAWPRDRLDVHHFEWERQNYHPDKWSGDKTPTLFREIPGLKGYVPRQFHNFLHAVTAEPEVPGYDVMEQAVESHRIHKALFEAARQVYVADRRPQASLRGKWVNESDASYAMLSKRIEIFDQRIAEMSDELPLDEILMNNSTDKIGAIAKLLGRTVARDSINLLPKIYRHQKARSL